MLRKRGAVALRRAAVSVSRFHTQRATHAAAGQPRGWRDTAGCALLLTSLLPDADATAAGVRSVGLIKALSELGFRPVVATASPVARSPETARRARVLLELYGAHCVQVAPNDAAFDEWLRDVDSGSFVAVADAAAARITAENSADCQGCIGNSSTLGVAASPTRWRSDELASAGGHRRGYLSTVIFNEFALEEQFSSRVAAATPHAVRIVDTQDLHCLRAARAVAVAEADDALSGQSAGAYRSGEEAPRLHPDESGARSSAPRLSSSQAESDIGDVSASLASYPVYQAMHVPRTITAYLGGPLAPDPAALDSIDASAWSAPCCELTLPPLPSSPASGSTLAGSSAVARGALGNLVFREAASLHRSDLGLFVSRVEATLAAAPPAAPHAPLQPAISGLGLAPHKVAYLPITLPMAAEAVAAVSKRPRFDERKDFCFIGTGKHAPNLDAVELLRVGGLWARIRAAITAHRAAAPSGSTDQEAEPELHVYGSHLPPALLSAPLPTGMHVLGFAPAPLDALLARYRILLCPVRFGAGVKGKVLDAWAAGTPVAATTVGAEDLISAAETPLQLSLRGCAAVPPAFGGIVADGLVDTFPAATAALYCDKYLWNAAASAGTAELARGYTDDAATAGLAAALAQAGFTQLPGETAALVPPTDAALAARRGCDLFAGLLWGHTHRNVEARTKILEVRAQLAALKRAVKGREP